MVEISCDVYFFCLVLVISFYLVLCFINLYVKMNILFVSVLFCLDILEGLLLTSLFFLYCYFSLLYCCLVVGMVS
jgi:hypothetical protein